MSDFDVLAGAVALDGRDVVDVGCGDGALVRRLAAPAPAPPTPSTRGATGSAAPTRCHSTTARPTSPC
jgi:cyclopropane fatty-acyl-phospholipid synthase-like methyltransferase